MPSQTSRGAPQAAGRNFGYKWQSLPQFLQTYQKRFLDNIHPLDPSFFRGKLVLEACCGIGIPDFFIGRAGARRVVGFDVSDSVFIARDRCRELSRLNFVQADIHHPPFQRRFDVAVCLAALHHLPIPQIGFEQLVSSVVPGGTVVVWVYAHEGSRWIRWGVDPVRRLLATRCPLPLLRLVAGILSLLLFLVLHGIYRPLIVLSKILPGLKKLPLFEYTRYILRWPLVQLHEMVAGEVSSMNGMSCRAYETLKKDSA